MRVGAIPDAMVTPNSRVVASAGLRYAPAVRAARVGIAARLAARVAAGALLATLVGAAAACGQARDVALELRTATEAAASLGGDSQVKDDLSALDCGAAYANPLAALCVQVYTLRGGTIVMEAACHDAPAVAGDDDLRAFLRGLSPLASGLSTDADVSVFVRILGYDDATRAADGLVLCGITPSLPGHLDESASPPTLPLYLLCHDPASAPSVAGTIFDDYCASSDFVALFP
jgi:hypothetical protein